MTIYNAYDEIAGLLSTIDPARLLKISASVESQQRLEVLIAKSKSQNITPEEKDELDHYIVLERLIRLAKIRARANQK